MRYKTYSEALVERFGEKVYKIPINLPLTCPNRDQSCGEGGCTFCATVGTGFENLDASVSIREQLLKNMAYIGPKYKAKKFIAYFNNFTNTYLAPEDLKNQMMEVVVEDVVGICISTRPDCISKAHLDVIESVKLQTGLEITIELGLQSINHRTLEKINRGHGMAEFIEAALAIKLRQFRLCVHLIGNLPWDDISDMIEAAKILSVLEVDEVKIHTLYLVKGTKMATQYLNGEFEMGSPEAYVERVVAFIKYISPQVVFQRFAGRAPEEETVFCNWGMSWWRIKDMIDEALERENVHQGDLCDYLNGPAVRKFLR